MNISMKLFYQYMAIFFNLSPTSNHLHPLQVENYDSNSRLVVDVDDNGKFRDERVKQHKGAVQNQNAVLPTLQVSRYCLLALHSRLW